jgi:7-carboxy-7-deazaguanine synthase
MRIIEIYQSKQGEGLLTGTNSVFVRTLGCMLRCRYCDTPFAQSGTKFEEEGADLSPDEIAGRVLLLDLPHVVITGGEPMLSPELGELTQLLKDYDYQITIETSGVVDAEVCCDLMSISPKLSNSTPIDDLQRHRDFHEKHRQRPEVVRTLLDRHSSYQLKFVVDTPDDFPEIEEYLKQFPNVDPQRVYLMPQVVDVEAMNEKADWIMPFCDDRGYRYCPRMQLVWYGNTRRT